MPKKLNIEKVKSELKNINPNVEILSNEYVNAKEKMYCECKNCGHKWFINWSDLKSNRSCPKCRPNRIRKTKSYTIEHLKRHSKEVNDRIEIIDTKYFNSRTPLKCRCVNCNRILFKTWDNIKKGTGCKRCSLSKARRPTLKEIKIIFEQKNIGVENIKTSKIGDKFIVTWTCSKCGETYKNDMYCIKNKKFCLNCFRKSQKGVNHPRYNFSLTISDRLNDRQYNKVLVNKWRSKIFQRDNYTCKVCGSFGKKLNAHHLNGYHWNLEGRYDVNNGITLCESCHKEFHKTYGNRNNTKEQFEDYLKHAQ
ncbi:MULTISPECIES: HNH endonuclease [Staphylococcus]|uniref:HNH endonuclease n=1 Tax=Staphylococcus TaxID=1279 RepID=UPI001FA9D51B|nr:MULTISPECIES: HNH endonuclease [Staphylococcus]DAI71509.1 MAG TPA: restriction enzyme [Caudoviricetes sp.]